MLEKIFQRLKNLEKIDLFVITTFFVIIFFFLYFTGTLNSGYHSIDDHQMISIKNSLIQTSFLETVFNYTKNDLLIRFRPLYYLYYISTVKVFGLNFLAVSIFVGGLAFFSLIFFYLGMKKLKQPSFLSFIFVLLIFCGSQTAIWWRLGTNETIGIFFLGLTFFFMASCFDKNKYNFNNYLFIVFLIISSLCKESFIIIIPALAMFKVWNEKRFFKITARESLINNKPLILPLVIMFIEASIIKFYVGTNQIGYAGVTSSSTEFITGIKNIILNPSSLLNWMILLTMLILIYLVSFLFAPGDKKKEFNNSIKTLSIYLVFALMIVVPQILMHAKSGMVERYLLPTTFGLAFLAIGVMQNTKQKIFKVFSVIVIFMFIVISLNTAKTNAVLFAESGKDANSLLSTVKNNSKVQSKILLVADPVDRFEVSYSIKRYLLYYGFNNFYGYPVMREYNSDFEIGLKNQWFKWFENKNLKDINGDPDLIIIFDKNQTETFFNQSKILKSDYKNILLDSESHAVYSKK